MNRTQLREVLDNLVRGTLSPDDAEQLLAPVDGTFIDLGDIKLDVDRKRRRGVAEAIFCQGKTAQQVLEIVQQLDARGQTVLCTRVSPETAEFVRNSVPSVHYHAVPRILAKQNDAPSRGHGLIAVVTAGTTDIPAAEEAAVSLETWGDEVSRIYDVGVAGIQRLFARLELLQSAAVVIVAAGMEAALPSVVAGLVQAPVVALPTSVGYGASFGGITALLGMLNSCSGGIATVNIDNGFGAGLLAHMINQVGIQRVVPQATQARGHQL